MKWGLLGVRLGILTVSLAVLSIVIFGILPLVTGGIGVDIPEGQTGWALRDNIILFDQPVKIDNGGFYDFEDLSIRFILEDAEGNLFADFRNEPVDVKAGENTVLDIGLLIDLNDLSEECKRQLAFEGTSLNMLVEVETGYMMNLLWLRLDSTEEVEWDPLIRGYGISQEGIHYGLTGDRIQMFIPYFIDASEVLDGTDVTVYCEVSNGTSSLGAAKDELTLGGFTEGELTLLLDEESSQWLSGNDEDLLLEFQVEFEGVSAHVDYHYHWSPPL